MENPDAQSAWDGFHGCLYVILHELLAEAQVILGMTAFHLRNWS